MTQLDKKYVIDLSKKKKEPEWMLNFRLQALETFNEMDEPSFGPTLNIDFDKIVYYKENKNEMTDEWNKVEQNIYGTFCDLGVVKAEQEYLYGVTNQYESEVIYHNMKDKDSGIIFTSTDDALKKYP